MMTVSKETVVETKWLKWLGAGISTWLAMLPGLLAVGDQAAWAVPMAPLFLFQWHSWFGSPASQRLWLRDFGTLSAQMVRGGSEARRWTCTIGVLSYAHNDRQLRSTTRISAGSRS